ncbi:MAG: alpha/beta hydrolase [Candidatus Kapabacteria bacterium]|nr:alpha/beta hydrolase [Ignavibacteriota bacterium]MCW5883975.1 alpha/beta hydrolase [Candidatus Kapabacteria bacterium]
MISHFFEIMNLSGDLIRGDIRIPSEVGKFPLVIFSHGFKGFRNWSFIPYICEKFVENNVIAINFDYSLNGIVDDLNQVYDDSIFRRNKVSVEVSDLSQLISKIIENKLDNDELKSKFNGEIYLAGHSLGGAVSILTARKFENIKKIALWASISQLDRNTNRQKEAWRENGSVEIEIAKTGQKLHLDYSYIEDKDTNFPDNAILNEMSKISLPVLIIHPDNDITVKMKEALELKSTESINKKRDLIVIPKAGHTFNCSHPFKGRNEAIETAIKSTLEFFKNT